MCYLGNDGLLLGSYLHDWPLAMAQSRTCRRLCENCDQLPFAVRKWPGLSQFKPCRLYYLLGCVSLAYAWCLRTWTLGGVAVSVLFGDVTSLPPFTATNAALGGHAGMVRLCLCLRRMPLACCLRTGTASLPLLNRW